MSRTYTSYGGRYEVIERVGAGGMAEVYRARDGLLGREVAIKVLSERLSRDRSFVERFRREAQSAANLNHPNIVSLYDYGSDDGTYFIVMEYIDGRPLDEIIKTEGPLMPERAAEIASEVADALERAHLTGLVHRDIKPSNIMITTQGRAKVTDFGIARALSRDGEQTMTQTGMVIGTAAYLSPEQAQGNPVDGRSDVYSLGCVLYEMLGGRTPFSGDTPLSIAYKHVREDPVPPSRVNPDVPAALDAIVMKAMAKNQDNRYSSAAELHADLQRFLSGQRVHATPLLGADTMVSPTAARTEAMRRDTEAMRQPPAARRRRNPLPFVLLALLLLALVGLAAWLLSDQLFGRPVRVPDVVGMNVISAQKLLDNRGLNWDVEPRFRDREAEDTVYRQDPEQGSQAEEGDTVTLFVSKGVRQANVPDLVGSTEAEAKRALKRANLKAEIQRGPSDDFEQGTVFDQSPEPGQSVDEGTKVEILVSSGPELVTVPDVFNQPEGSAIDELENFGLTVDVIRANSNEVDEGLVFAQDPDAGAQVVPETLVTISVSLGPETQEMPDVTGEDADEAEAFLEEDFGLSVSQEEGEACPQPPGTVCSQDPKPGADVAQGDEAVLFVNPDVPPDEGNGGGNGGGN